MVRYKIFVALLCGAAFSASLVLLLNLPLPVVPALLSLLLFPGALLVAVFTKPGGFGPPVAVLAANALVYSAIAYAGVSLLGRGSRRRKCVS